MHCPSNFPFGSYFLLSRISQVHKYIPCCSTGFPDPNGGSTLWEACAALRHFVRPLYIVLLARVVQYPPNDLFMGNVFDGCKIKLPSFGNKLRYVCNPYFIWLIYLKVLNGPDRKNHFFRIYINTGPIYFFLNNIYGGDLSEDW